MILVNAAIALAFPFIAQRLTVASEIAERNAIWQDTTSISALVWTILLAIGLFFFIRAAGKDRTEQRRWSSSLSVEEMGLQLQRYLRQRSYQLTDRSEGIATFIGRAQPSGFLTVLLSLLAAIGLTCLAIVLDALLYPNWQGTPFALVLAAPLAGWYYRSKTAREETLRLKVEALEAGDTCQIAISGHRDELDAMAAQLPLEEVWE